MIAPTCVISPYHAYSIGAGCGSFGAAASGVWPAANRAFFIPFRLDRPVTVTVFGVYNGITVGNGSVDVGIYSDDGPSTSTARLIISSRAVATSGASAIQTLDIPDTPLGAGRFYIAIVMSSASDTVFRVGLNNTHARAVGVCQMASAYPLPLSATLAAAASTFLPMVGFATAPRTFL